MTTTRRLSALAIAIAIGLVGSAPPATSAESPLDAPLAVLRSAAAEGRDNPALAKAWKSLVTWGRPADLPHLIRGMEGANPIGANWIRSAIESIATPRLAAGAELPTKELEVIVMDTRLSPLPRQVAFEWLTSVDGTAVDRLEPKMLDDPAAQFRRRAVARVLDEARKLKYEPDAVREFRRALGHARDPDQIDEAAKKLRELGEEVDLARHFGFIQAWRLIGPFDNAGGAGFDGAYGPESNADLDAGHEGKDGEVEWIEHTTKDELGSVDLNAAIVHAKGVVAYAAADFVSSSARDVELRFGTVNAWKVWLNGTLLHGREEYHHGTQIDHYRVTGRLKPGKNRILLKVCQNEQTDDWADPWGFQLRVCDASGTAVLSAEGGAPKKSSETPTKTRENEE